MKLTRSQTNNSSLSKARGRFQEGVSLNASIGRYLRGELTKSEQRALLADAVRNTVSGGTPQQSAAVTTAGPKSCKT